MKRVIALLCMVLALLWRPVFAADGKAIVFAVEQGKPVAMSLIEKADYVAFAVTIVSKQKESEDEFREIGEARQHLIREAQKNKKIKVHNGPIYLSSTSNSQPSFSYSSSQVTVNLLISIAEADGDVFKAASAITDLVEGIQPPGKAAYSLSPLKLAVENPDRYRAKLLNMIYDETRSMQSMFNKPIKCFVTGLENPVTVTQYDFTHVELFINYTLSIELMSD
ncbi:MAG: hypothetical protein ACMUIS_02120 [bacterium]